MREYNQSLPDEIPIEEFKGELIPFNQLPEDVRAQSDGLIPQEEAHPQEMPEEIPLDQFKGEFKELTKVDMLKMIGRAASEIGSDVNDKVNKERERIINDLTRQISRKEKQGIVSDLLKAFIKEPAKGIGKTIDMPKDAALFTADVLGQPNIGTDDLGIPQYSSNMPLARNAPDLPSVEKGVEKVVDTATLGMTDSDYSNPYAESFGSGMHFLAQLAGVGGIGNVAKKYGWEGVSKIAGFLGSTDPKVLAGAFAFGATDKALEKDSGTLERLGFSTAAALGTQAAVAAGTGILKNPQKAIKMAKGLPYKAAKIGLGITKENFNKDIAKAFVDAGMEAPVSAVTDSKVVAFANKIIGKIPYLAEFVSKRHQKLEEQFKGGVSSIAERIGPQKTEEVSKEIESAFDKMREFAGEGNIIDISKPMEVAQGIVNQLKKAKANDDPSKATISFLEDILNGYKGGKGSSEHELKTLLSDSMYNSLTQPQKQNFLKALQVAESETVTTVDALVEQYIQLNGKMSDKGLFKDENGKRALNLLHRFRNSLNNAFKEYGAENLAFNEARAGANELFSTVKKRQEWDAFWEKYTKRTEDTHRYVQLHEALTNTKIKRELTKLVGKNMVENLELLTKTSKGMAKSRLNDPQPSGTEIMRTIKQYGSQLMHFIGAATTDVVTNHLTLGLQTASLAATTWALQSKNFVRKLVEFSERPTQSKAEFLQKILKENTGVGFVELQKEFLKINKSPDSEDE